MKTTELWIGLVAFSLGVVLVFNLGNLLPYNSYGNTLTGGQLATTLITELIVAVLVFGGLILIGLSLELKKPDEPTPTKPAKQTKSA
ncbi:MAG: hypothetical protein KGH78_02200 [Candidatus Micrarchaeota archaeon]|nr:hypothetical protein [Candidatus Micrarchaeota archaeon]